MSRPHILSGLLALTVAGTIALTAAQAEHAVQAPAPAFSVRNPAPSETAMFAGGCFWGVQGVFQHVRGVKSAVSGYTGATGRAGYEAVSGGDTGHAEAVRVTFDPRQVSYAQLLQIYFSVVADPTTLNAQGPDRGTQYRSALFPMSEAQRRVAVAYISQLGKARVWPRPIVTRIERAQPFYPAETYHQDYLTRNPQSAYIRINDLPKVAALRSFYPKLWRAQPVLVRG
ncbi:peptide-methionine (S)-S-oxide reductase MsrA [Sphingomonas jatrophae]|uniref:Peptide methionine sulfoxide reductase MsrA n=1 Tax=Sphingomonas jatrophae TaxID=1166337 RepID=A0A1I6M6X3_9SPHN|nr:peptide-methionine (S)-S-oxide reductase MsrA [Sphingomonas jatrophae]SFS11252.1 peptide-methionine (S)-S-oxide reductase [Sphingomonas jatrophae]